MDIENENYLQQRYSIGDNRMYTNQDDTRPKQRRASFSSNSIQRLKSLFRNDNQQQSTKQPEQHRYSVISPPCSPTLVKEGNQQQQHQPPPPPRCSLTPPISPSHLRQDSGHQLLKKATVELCQTYHQVNSSFRYDSKHNPRRVLTKPGTPWKNCGFDNHNSDYILYVNGSLGGKYKVLDLLGSGTFGQVAKCRNILTGDLVAIKVIKNKPAYLKQSEIEVEILNHLNHDWDPDDKHHILRLLEHFMYKHHLCLVFELLAINLYDLIKQNSFKGFSTKLIRTFTAQLLDTLVVLYNAKIIHCDLKPENIMLKTLQTSTIKVVDFGSACQETNQMYTYIQSRFYRSPEVLLGLDYSVGIDMWSFGCILLELFLGLPIFPGTSEYNQLSRIIDTLGLPPNHMIEQGKHGARYFNIKKSHNGQVSYTFKSRKQYSSEQKKQEKQTKYYFGSTQLDSLIMDFPCSKRIVSQSAVDYEMSTRLLFLDFLKHILCFDPDQRLTPQQALLHPFYQHHQHYHHKAAASSASSSSQVQYTKKHVESRAPVSTKCNNSGQHDGKILANGCICSISKPSNNHCPNL
ncbi:kinase-like domain-containing protein [Chlamydoabsidia padenii]|nr:kinase-like domain-containing protein [Chlamydoabsidia padenii]